ncbi:MAG TPA: G/U mismatch-specific DNA glycosylase [Anaerolineales bacterium]|nr:G/U mismatch-specific DNA glycosylase [Anaerolineales bacterium]
MPPTRPTRAEILAAAGKSVPDVIGPRLKVLFCGINPGLYTAAIGHHFGRPGNRFWPALYAAGFTDRLLSPYEERLLLERGYGITNLVNRATASANELSREELVAGGRQLLAKVNQYTPGYLAVVGIGAYRSAFQRLKARPGLQPETIGNTWVWVLPNPSGLNAHYNPEDLARLFGELRQAVDATS